MLKYFRYRRKLLGTYGWGYGGIQKSPGVGLSLDGSWRYLDIEVVEVGELGAGARNGVTLFGFFCL